jgi:hypothetical protein
MHNQAAKSRKSNTTGNFDYREKSLQQNESPEILRNKKPTGV